MTSTEVPAPRPPWAPEGLPALLLRDLDRLRYVVVDEVDGDLVALSVSRWPTADELGRVRFDDAPVEDRPVCTHVLVHRRELHDQLYAGWLRRDPRVGDAFAAQVGGALSARRGEDGDVVLDDGTRLADAFPGLVVDLTAQARTLAKLAFFAAVAGVQPEEQAVALGQVPAAQGHRPATSEQVEELQRRVRSSPWRGPRLHRQDGAGDVAGQRWTVPAERWRPASEGGFADAVRTEPTALVHLLLNVGDGDCQLLLLPQEQEREHRRALVVDAGTTGKLPRLMAALARERVLAPVGADGGVCALVVATHPHDDHIEGIPELLRTYGGRPGGVEDLWEPGYYAPTGAFAEMMAAVEDCGIRHCEPTAGLVAHVGGARITVLAPSVQLRTAYDTHGVDCNDASIVLKVEFPAVRIASSSKAGRLDRQDLRLPSPWSLVLGADAQTRSWSHVTADFPPLHRGHDAALHRALRQAQGRDLLAAHVLKVSHHASKHGINIELVERVRPRVTLISSVGGGGRHGFPHALATQAIAEALAPSARSGRQPPRDADLGIHYTGGLTSDGAPLGSVALLVPARRGARLRMWRFGDTPREDVDLTRGRLLHPIYAARP